MKQTSIMLAFATLSVTVLFVIFTFTQAPAYIWICEMMVFAIVVAAFLVLLYVFQQDRARLKILTDLLPEGEGLVLKELIEHHKLSETDLQTRTALSQRQFSTVMKKLKSKKLIAERQGQIYLVMDL